MKTSLEKLVDKIGRVQNPWIEQMDSKKKRKFERDKEVITEYIKDFLFEERKRLELSRHF